MKNIQKWKRICDGFLFYNIMILNMFDMTTREREEKRKYKKAANEESGKNEEKIDLIIRRNWIIIKKLSHIYNSLRRRRPFVSRSCPWQVDYRRIIDSSSNYSREIRYRETEPAGREDGGRGAARGRWSGWRTAAGAGEVNKSFAFDIRGGVTLAGDDIWSQRETLLLAVLAYNGRRMKR